MDIDCIDSFGLLMNDVIYSIAEKHGLPNDWINTDFVHTDSYSEKIIQYSVPYKTFCNCLTIRTIKDEYLLAMKLLSIRDYKHDWSDIFGIIDETKENGKIITSEMVYKAFDNLYQNKYQLTEAAKRYLEQIISGRYSYREIVEQEEKNQLRKEQIWSNKKRPSEEKIKTLIEFIDKSGD